MKQLLLICAVVMGQSVLAVDKKIADETGSYTLKTKNGKKTFSAKDKNGDELFTGPVDNEKQRDALDRNLIKKLEQLEGMGGGKGGLHKEESAKVIEAAIRKQLRKPTGELIKADLGKVTGLNFRGNQLTDVSGLEKLTQLTVLQLRGNNLTGVKVLEKLTKLEHLDLTKNPDLTKAQIAELQKALPKCKIRSNTEARRSK